MFMIYKHLEEAHSTSSIFIKMDQLPMELNICDYSAFKFKKEILMHTIERQQDQLRMCDIKNLLK